jgi:hypothetical protein
MCVVHRACGTRRCIGTRAQFLARKQQRCGRHDADLAYEAGDNDSGEMQAHGAHRQEIIMTNPVILM